MQRGEPAELAGFLIAYAIGVGVAYIAIGCFDLVSYICKKKKRVLNR